ncbi:hypothetical protein Misp01_04050 [Microtetraspora sp. NBRC 13810]|nr:hypothetical protein [Microtetraspora sp. NBRC 13810]GLW05275.1 hypothetical protein Misp01_04050 [Microtetraspora sp. NBRC 13810]
MRHLVTLKAVRTTSPPPPELTAAIAGLGEETAGSGAPMDFGAPS